MNLFKKGRLQVALSQCQRFATAHHVWHEDAFLRLDFLVKIRIQQQLLELGDDGAEDDRMAKDRPQIRTQAVVRYEKLQVTKLKLNQTITLMTWLWLW